MALSNIAKSFLLVSIALLASTPAGQSLSATGPRIAGACNPTKVKFALSAHDTETTSTSPVSIVDTGMTFTQAKPGCVIVDFQAIYGLADPPPGAMFIRAVLAHSGGTTVAGRPDLIRVSLADSDSETRSMEFVFPDVTPGNYVIRMKVNSSNGGGVTVDFPDTVVHYD